MEFNDTDFSFTFIKNAGSLIYAVQYDKNIDRKVAIVQGAYGVGALAAPLLATHFSSLKHWNFCYFTSISGAILNATFLSLVFRFRHLDGSCYIHV